MKKIAFVAMAVSSFCFSAFANGEKYIGRCAVLRQLTKDIPAKLLANVNVALNPGDTKLIYKDGNIRYEISLASIPQSTPARYVVETTITYGVPNFLGQAQSEYTESAVTAGLFPGVGISLPGFHTFGCGNP